MKHASKIQHLPEDPQQDRVHGDIGQTKEMQQSVEIPLGSGNDRVITDEHDFHPPKDAHADEGLIGRDTEIVESHKL